MTVRRLRAWADAAAAAAGILRAAARRAGAGFTCLTYHRVLERAGCADYADALAMPVDLFERQVRWLAERCRVVTVSDALARTGRGEVDARRPLMCVTFDDGYADNAEIAAPVLERHGLVGTFFVVTDFVGGGHRLWYDRASAHWRRAGARACGEAIFDERGRESRREGGGAALPTSERDWLEVLKRLPSEEREGVLARLDTESPAGWDGRLYRAMTPGDLRALVTRGHEVGSHTRTHPILTRENDEVVREELGGSRRRLEAWLGEAVRGVCYPNGDSDERVARLAREAGYAYGCATRPGVNSRLTPPMELCRRHIQASDVADSSGAHSETALAAEVWGVHAWMRRWRPGP